MNKLQKARWRNIIKKAAHVNRLIKKGYIVFDHFNHKVGLFKFDNTRKLLYQGDTHHRLVWVSSLENWGTALKIPIKVYNAERFDKWRAVHPKDFIKI